MEAKNLADFSTFQTGLIHANGNNETIIPIANLSEHNLDMNKLDFVHSPVQYIRKLSIKLVTSKRGNNARYELFLENIRVGRSSPRKRKN